MRYAIVSETYPENEFTTEKISSHGAVLNGKDLRYRDHALFDNIFSKESEYETVVIYVKPEQMVPWVKEYFEGNKVNIVTEEDWKGIVKALIEGFEVVSETVSGVLDNVAETGRQLLDNSTLLELSKSELKRIATGLGVKSVAKKNKTQLISEIQNKRDNESL